MAKRELNLQYFEAITASRGECVARMAKRMPPPIPFDQKFICTNNPIGARITYGDDGSPVVANHTLVAIASWNTEYLRGPDFFTNIFVNMNFINVHVN